MGIYLLEGVDQWQGYFFFFDVDVEWFVNVVGIKVEKVIMDLESYIDGFFEDVYFFDDFYVVSC